MASYTKIKANNKQGYKWICTIEGPPDPVTGKRTQIPRRGDTQKEAYDKAKEEYKKRKQGITSKKIKKLTFSDVCDEWFATYKLNTSKEGTIISRDTQLKLLKKHFKDQSIAKITHYQYQNYINSLFKENYARNTILGVDSAANLIFKYAIKNKWINENPKTGVVIPQKKITIEELENQDKLIEEKYLERSEIKEFLDVVSTYGKVQEREIFYLFIFSGFRSGELCALKWADINFEENSIRVSKNLGGNNRKKYRLDTPKTDKSARVVSIDDSIMHMLSQHQLQQAERKSEEMKLYTDYHNKDFVFRRYDGYPYNPATIYQRMLKLLKKTNINKKATPHIFRHTHISMLAEAGVDLITIMNRVGHENEKTTLSIYTHVTKKMMLNADKKIKIHFADLLNDAIAQDM
jgi:integrase